MNRDHLLTLSGAKRLAESRGYSTEERDGRLYFSRLGEEVGSTLISTYQPEGGEPEIARHAVDSITDKPRSV